MVEEYRPRAVCYYSIKREVIVSELHAISRAIEEKLPNFNNVGKTDVTRRVFDILSGRSVLVDTDEIAYKISIKD